MVWVRSEYAGELAVLSAWIAALLPWNVTYSGDIPGFPGSILYLRFPFFEIQYGWGTALEEANGFLFFTLYTAARRQSGETVSLAYDLWIATALVLVLALGLSILYYLEEERVEASRIDPVRSIGVLLLVAGAGFVGASYLIVTRGIPGIPIPIGAVFMLVLGGILLSVERR